MNPAETKLLEVSEETSAAAQKAIKDLDTFVAKLLDLKKQANGAKYQLLQAIAKTQTPQRR